MFTSLQNNYKCIFTLYLPLDSKPNLTNMRFYPTFLLIGILVASCTSSTEVSTIASNLPVIKMDTVQIDSREELIFVFNGLSVSDLSEDERYFYNFDFKTPSLEVLDLETLTFSERVLFEKEGPNGAGGLVYDFNRIGDDRFFLGSKDFNFGIFNLQAEKIRNIPFESLEKLLKNPVAMNQGKVLSESPLVLAGNFTIWPTNGEEIESILGAWNIDDERIDIFPLANWFEVTDFQSIIANSSDDGPIKSFWITVKALNGSMIASTNVSSDLMTYQDGKFEKRSINHQLMPSKKSFKLSPIYESREAFQNDVKKSRADINFLHPVWDNKHQHFYRFAYQAKSTVSDDYKVFLIAMNKDFELLWEMEVPELSKQPNFHFVRDGVIWMFENVNDEVNFVRLRMED